MLNLNTLKKTLFLALALTISTFQITNATAADTLTLDNGQPGTSFNGTWKVSGGVNPYGGNSLYASANGASYTFDVGLTTPGEYQVFAWWTEWSNANTSQSIVDFDAPTPSGSSNSLLSGVFEGIDFGQGQWRWESAWKTNPSNHVYFDSSSGQSRNFQFARSPAVLTGMRVTAGASGVLTLSDDAGQTYTTSLSAGRLVTIKTGWMQAAKTVTVNYSAGWELAVDDVTYVTEAAGGDSASRRTSVPIDITHLGGTSTVTVNQRQKGGQWNQLGTTWNFDTTATIAIRSLGNGTTSADAIKLVYVGNNTALPVFPVDLRGNTPEQASVTINTNKPAGATDGIITLTTYDADFPDEGELIINGNTPVALFGPSGTSGNDQNSADISFSTPASYWRNGDNTLLFRHTRTQGYVIDAVTVSFESSQSGSNAAPVLASIGGKSVTAGTTLYFSISATDSDGTLPILEASGLPTYSYFADNKDGTGFLAIWPGQSSAPATQNITFTARDAQNPNLTDSETITILIEPVSNGGGNTAPKISGSPATSVTVGNNYAFQPSASDADGDPLTFTITGRPSWASFDNSTGRLSGTPGSAGTFSNIRISASDGQSRVALPSFSIKVNDAAPLTGPVFPVDLRGTTPEQASITINTNKPAGATDGIITLTTYDADFPDEGELVINGNTPVALFGASGVTGNDQHSANISFRTPASYWRNGDNTLLFRHTRTQGYIIDAATVSFETATNTTPPINGSPATGSVSLSWTAPVARADGSALALSEISGYTLYYGTSAGNHPNSLNINNGSATSATITDLSPGTYFAVVTTLDSGGRESSYSSEVRIVMN